MWIEGLERIGTIKAIYSIYLSFPLFDIMVMAFSSFFRTDKVVIKKASSILSG